MKTEILNSIKKDQVFAIIPARSGSKGVKNKNIKLLNGFPMIAYTIATAKLAEGIDRIIVSTDSSEYAEIARSYGAEVPFLRPAEISGDKATDLEFMQHAINWFYENEGSVPEYWVHLRTTTPFRDFHKISEAIERFKNDDTADSLRSAHPADVSPYKWFRLNDGEYFKTLFDGMTLDEANNPRQGFADVYIPDGYVDVLRTSHIVKNDLLHGKRMLSFCLPASIDVDNPKDFDELEVVMKNHRNEISDYLENLEIKK